MCNVENIGDKWFKSNVSKSRDDIEENTFTKTMLTIDTAGVKNKDRKRSDSFSFVVGSAATNNFKYVRSGQLRKFNEFDEYINHVIDLLYTYEDITHIYIEKNTYNGLDVERIQQEIAKDEHSKLAVRQIVFINEMQRKNKDEKISTIVSDVNNGRIIFCSERVENDFLEQLMDFAGQKFTLHDDAVDSVAEFANRIEDIEVRNKRLQTLDRKLLGI
ncbi:hypothetical protein LG307_14800 [Sutcliffiella horikoshii]|uniref:hypothetical protein n=1 Tax=Sutcliffiella horikoshii TaxID=79883 RepID=UPI00384EF185